MDPKKKKQIFLAQLTSLLLGDFERETFQQRRLTSPLRVNRVQDHIQYLARLQTLYGESCILSGRDVSLQGRRVLIEHFKEEMLRLTTVETSGAFHRE